jgi:hypothetical protein
MNANGIRIGLRAALACFAALAAVGVVAFLCPVGPRQIQPAGMTPIRDDELAERYLPRFSSPPEFGPILAVYYRAATDENGFIRIAYHPVWGRERNDAPGLAPFLSRILYTGGLSLQRLAYGLGDIECIGLTVDPSSLAVVGLEYETAEGYSSSDFDVRHAMITAKGPFSPPLRFRVVSWNHLFTLEDGVSADYGSRDLATGLAYFSSALWSRYSMTKGRETFVKKDRAHFAWELQAAR